MTEDGAARDPVEVGVPADVEDRLREVADKIADQSIIILPTEVRNGKTYYLPADTEARKAAQGVGLYADFLYSGQDRSYLHEYSAEWLLNFAIAVSQNLSADLIIGIGKYVLARADSAVRRGIFSGSKQQVPLKVTIQQVARSGDGEVRIKGLSFEGEAQAVVDSIREALAFAQQPQAPQQINANNDNA